jgi:putative transposase
MRKWHHAFWFDIPNHFPHTSLDAFVVMPNHIHGILVINEKWEIPRTRNVETDDEQIPKLSPFPSPSSSVETHNYASLPATEKTATEKTATEKTATEKTATEKTATEKTATEKTAAEKTAAEKTATAPPAASFDFQSDNIPPPLNTYFKTLSAPAKSLSTIIRAYKSIVTIASRQIDSSFGWQSRFHDHIIRNDNEHSRIANYIRNNPSNWKEDRFFYIG